MTDLVATSPAMAENELVHAARVIKSHRHPESGRFAKDYGHVKAAEPFR